MNHDHMSHTTTMAITEMQVMWILMAVMFAWNFYMAFQHHQLEKKVECHCGTHPCVKCEEAEGLK